MKPVVAIIIEVLLGALAGYLASRIMGGKENSWILNCLLGIVGSVVGGWIAGLIALGGGVIVQLVIAVAGACLVIWLVRKLGLSK